ncbi:MAG: ATP-binding protein, partial [Dysgonamonadaceae bacterium]|jgi:hypothetical protein|nr:ATP-binding protein [Dysgonamonadaceae bacterium]
MDNLEANEAIRTELKGFYGLMKSMDEYLRFVFYTGVTKFSKISIFSDLNQPNDISLAEDYAEICGISEKELLHNFQPEISLMAEKRELTVEQTLTKLKQCYDGYHFAENSAGMYNPFSLLNAFFKLSFDYYWYQTGTPSFLVKMIASGEMDIRDLKNDVYVDKLQLNDYKSGVNDPVPILYQSGYLTIKNYIPEENAYILGYPNEEVKYGFMRNLADEFIPYTHLSPTNFSAIMFTRDLRTGNVDGFMTRLKSRFASIPYDLTDRTERSYQLGFYLIFELMGQYVETEVKSARGRADVVVKTKDAIFVFEFKMDKNATAEDALRQIDEKGYLIPYTADKRKLIKTGVEISAKERGISRWIVVES